MVDVYVVNESGHLSDQEAFQIASALDRQAHRDFAHAGWRSDVRCQFLPGGGKATIPAGGMVVHLLDTIDVQGALGYHDEDGREVPYARVGVITAEQDGSSACEVASHELLELVTDPHVNLTAATGDLSRLYALEPCDACQGNGYDVGSPVGKRTGLIVADFVLPSYFDPNTHAAAVTDFRGALRGPFTMSPGGYNGYIDLSDIRAGWQQEFGSQRSALPAWSERLARRGASLG